MRFLIKESFKAPPTAEVEALIPAEKARVKELTEQGLFVVVYLAADQSGAWAIWNADSQAALEEAHDSLPLHPYMNSEITLLAEEM